jgi:hypothetical protein
MHLKPTAGCQISILIFEKKLWRRGLYKYPMKNISRTAKFFIYKDPLHNFFSNIKVDILKPCCGREMHYPT